MTEKPGNYSPAPPVVVKLGGSLFKHVPELVPVFLASSRPLLIVSGGGIFADAIRKLLIDDDSVH